MVYHFVGHRTRILPGVFCLIPHAPLMPSSSLERVAATRTTTAGQALRELTGRIRTPLCAPGGACVASVRARLAEAEGGQVRWRMPALQLQRGRPQRVPLIASLCPARTRYPPQVCMPDGGAPLLAYASWRDHSRGAISRAETIIYVCRDAGISQTTTCTPQSAVTSRSGDGWTQGGRRDDRGPSFTDHLSRYTSTGKSGAWNAAQSMWSSPLVQLNEHVSDGLANYRHLLQPCIAGSWFPCHPTIQSWRA